MTTSEVLVANLASFDVPLPSCLSQILNNVNGNLDAKRACAVALKLHRRYLKKVIIYFIIFHSCFLG